MDSTRVAPTGSEEEKSRRAIRGAFFGFFVDMFDIYLPVVVLTPAIKYFVSPDLCDGATALVAGMVFASTLVGRPVGALIFGHYADRIGRKRATLISVTGFGVLTLRSAACRATRSAAQRRSSRSSRCASSSAYSSAASTRPPARSRWSTRARRSAGATRARHARLPARLPVDLRADPARAAVRAERRRDVAIRRLGLAHPVLRRRHPGADVRALLRAPGRGVRGLREVREEPGRAGSSSCSRATRSATSARSSC